MGTQGNFYAAYHEPLITADGEVYAAVLGSDDTSNLGSRGSFFDQRGSNHWGQNGVCHAKWSDVPENVPQYRTSDGSNYALTYEGKGRSGYAPKTLHWSDHGISISIWLTGPWGYPRVNRWYFAVYLQQQVSGARWYQSSTHLVLEDKGDGSGDVRYYYNFPSGIGVGLVPGWGQLIGKWPRGGGTPEHWWGLYANYILTNVQRAADFNPPTRANATLRRVTAEVIEYPAPDTKAFLFGEPSWSSDWSRVEHHDAFEMLKEGCYLNAVQSLPRLSQNSIQNLLEVVSFIMDIKSGALKLAVDVPTSVKVKQIKTTVSGGDLRSTTKGQLRAHTRTVNANVKRETAHYGRALREVAGDSWLQYRYAYGTTTMDFKEALDFVQRKRDLSKVKEFTLHGSSSMGVEGRAVTMRCRIPVVNHMDDAAHNMWDTLYVYGLQPDLYILWDMIPYSFIVDWALPVGDFASAIDTMNNLQSSYWSLGSPTYSLKYNSGRNNTVSCYTRWPGTAPPMLLNGVWANQGTSYRTMAKRGADTISLII